MVVRCVFIDPITGGQSGHITPGHKIFYVTTYVQISSRPPLLIIYFSYLFTLYITFAGVQSVANTTETIALLTSEQKKK